MSIYFVSAASSTPGAVSTPNNGNDGLCPVGLGGQSISPSYNAATRTITDPGFGNIVGNNSLAGCLVYIAWGGATGGVDGLYEVESNDIGLQTVVLKLATGLATVNTTALLFSDGPWATLTYMASAMPVASAGGDDHRIIRTNWEDGTELVYRGTTANFTWANTGTSSKRIRVVPADRFGKETTTQRVLIGGATSSGGATTLWALPTSLANVNFVNLEFVGTNQGGGQPTTGISTGSGSVDIQFKNCVFRNFSGIGASVSSTANRYTFTDCIASNNGTSGFSFSASAAGTVFTGCTAFSNAQAGFSHSGTTAAMYENCTAFGNTQSGFALTAAATSVNFIGCVSFDNTQNGFIISSTGGSPTFLGCLAAFNGGDGWNIITAVTGARFGYCSAANNTGWGWNIPTAYSRISVFPDNHAFGNGSGAFGTASADSTYFAARLISTDDPLFTSTQASNRNLTPLTGSPLLTAGFQKYLGQNTIINRPLGGVLSQGSSVPPLRNRN